MEQYILPVQAVLGRQIKDEEDVPGKTIKGLWNDSNNNLVVVFTDGSYAHYVASTCCDDHYIDLSQDPMELSDLKNIGLLKEEDYQEQKRLEEESRLSEVARLEMEKLKILLDKHGLPKDWKDKAL